METNLGNFDTAQERKASYAIQSYLKGLNGLKDKNPNLYNLKLSQLSDICNYIKYLEMYLSLVEMDNEQFQYNYIDLSRKANYLKFKNEQMFCAWQKNREYLMNQISKAA